jgi:hypothetical protein
MKPVYTTGRLIAIGFIFVCTSAAWMILGGTITWRTGTVGERLRAGVQSIWGSPHEQAPAIAQYTLVKENKAEEEFRLPLEGSDIKVKLEVEHRKKGLLWYGTYTADFDATYTFRNTSDAARNIRFRLPFPAEKAMFENVAIEINGRSVLFRTAGNHQGSGIEAESQIAAGETARMHVVYRSRGLSSWRYKLADQVGQARNFALVMRTNFDEVDFPEDTLSPTSIGPADHGRELTWRYSSLISGFAIGMTMPERVQPGPMAGNIIFFAPVSLLLFFFVMLILTVLRGIDLHPVNYFFLACSYFSFHLLLAYLVDQISIQLAFVICSLVAVGLVVSYLRIVVGPRFAIVEAGLSTLVYLVVFSWTFFLKGFTGLTVAICCVLTLAIAMRLTAHIRWSERFASRRTPVAGEAS